ncbi:unnamed protein product [Peniophora sp. CBMAI 1063]|nr:unnamed protein product [Peniophora sp. CBMAI 1063]
MGSDDSLPSIQTLVETMHARGILYHILGPVELSRRISAIAAKNNLGDPTAPTTFHAFVQSCYYHGDHRPRIPVVHNAIAFYACLSSDRNNILTLDWYAYSYCGQNWYIIDVETDDLSRIVPLRVYSPYHSSAPRRTAAVLDKSQPLPFWIVRRDGLGVSLVSDDLFMLRHDGMQFQNIAGGTRTTVMIQWPGYPRWKSQIRMGPTKEHKSEDYTYRRLVSQVRAKIRKFITEHINIASEDPHWAVGDAGSGRIAAHDLILLAIIEVSQGAVMPILKLRDDFVFADSIPPATALNTPAMVPPSDTQSSSHFPFPAFPSGACMPDINGLD